MIGSNKIESQAANEFAAKDKKIADFKGCLKLYIVAVQPFCHIIPVHHFPPGFNIIGSAVLVF